MHPSLISMLFAGSALAACGVVFGLALRVTSGRAWSSGRWSSLAGIADGLRAWSTRGEEPHVPVSGRAEEVDDETPPADAGPPAGPELDEEPGPGTWTPPGATRVRGRLA